MRTTISESGGKRAGTGESRRKRAGGGGPRRAVALLLVLAVLVSTAPGCVSVGKGTADYHYFSGNTFGGTVVTFPFYIVGYLAFFFGTLPLVIFSGPLTAIFYPDPDEDEAAQEYRTDCLLAPSMVAASFGGTLVALPFFPLGLPFMEDRSEDEEDDGADGR